MEKTLTPILLFSAFLLATARWAPRWALRRPALVGVLTAAFAAWGLVTLAHLPVELMPNVASETVTITVGVRGGMAPGDVETLIARPLEEALGDLPRLKTLISSAKKDRGVLTLEFEPGVDMKMVTAEVHERVDRALGRLPAEIEKPVIAHFEENDAPVYIAALSSDKLSPEEIREIVDGKIKDRLLRVPGTANVEVGGGREGKILVELSRDKLLAYGLSVHRIASLLGRRNVAVQAGSVEGSQRISPVRIVGSLHGVQDMENVVVAREPGVGASRSAEGTAGTVLLGQVAKVSRSFLEPESLSRLNGAAAVSLYIQKESSANTISVVKGLERAFDAAWNDLPPALKKHLTRVVVSNQAVNILSAMASVRVSLICGILLILLALCLFESARPFTKKLAAVTLGVLLAIMCVCALLKISDIRMEPLYLVLLIVFIAAALFDPDFRAGFIVAGSMPLSAIFCLILFEACGITLNVMSLFGLALGLGMLVDNATVVFENIVRKNHSGAGREQALAATEEMVIPLIGATVTNAIVFVPFIFLSEDIQMMYTDVAAAVGASLFASMAISLTVVPLLTAMVPLQGEARWPWQGNTAWERRIRNLLEKTAGVWKTAESTGLKFWRAARQVAAQAARALWAHVYPPLHRYFLSHPSLEDLGPRWMTALFLIFFAGLWITSWTAGAKWLYFAGAAAVTAGGFALFRDYGAHWEKILAHRFHVLALSIALATLGGAILIGATDRDFQTAGELDEFVIFVELSSGAKLSVSSDIVGLIEKKIAGEPEISRCVKTLVSRVEGWSSKVYVTLVPRAGRRLTTEQVQDALRIRLKDAGKDLDPNAFIHFSSARAGQEVTVQVMGPDYAVLEQLAQKICGALEKIKGLEDVKMRYRPGRPEVLARVIPEKAAQYGFTAESAAETTHALMRGLRATTIRRGGEQTETIVRLRLEDRASLSAVADIPLLNRRGETLRLGQVARLEMSKMPNEIFRENKERLIQITANRAGLSLGRAAADIQAALDLIPFPLEYHAALEGDVQNMTKSLNQLAWGVLVMVLLVYLILVFLFESILQPLIIMTTVPLCVIGVAAGLILFDVPISTGALVGVMMLGGVVVNNAIMLIDHLNGDGGSGLLSDRLRNAALARMRPIFLTAGSAVLGFLPMMLDTSESGALWRPLAITMVFGLLTSTVFTLFVVPCLSYVLMSDLPRWFANSAFFRWDGAKAENPAS